MVIKTMHIIERCLDGIVPGHARAQVVHMLAENAHALLHALHTDWNEFPVNHVLNY